MFFVEYAEREDPLRVLTGMQKAAAAACVVLLQVFFCGLYFLANMSDSSSLHASSTIAVAGIIAASFARPALGACDKVFRYSAQKMSSRLSQGHARNDLLYAGASLHCALDLIDMQSALEIWCSALEELKVVGCL